MIQLSPIDLERFGVVTARDPDVTSRGLPSAHVFCRDNGVQLFIARCNALDLSVAQELEAAGGRLMDTLVYYTRSLGSNSLPEHSSRVAIRPFRMNDIEGVRQVSGECFKGYYGHYHADARLDRHKCDDTYQSWAYRSCVSREVADEVLVADDGQVAGFATLRINSPAEAEGVLFGVAPRAQGAGIYRALMVEGMRWCKAQGRERMVVSTQLTNLAVQRVWTRLGFEPARSYYTFHLWYDSVRLEQ